MSVFRKPHDQDRCSALRPGWPLSLLLFLAATAGLSAAQPEPADSLALAGGNDILWIVTGEPDPARQEALNWVTRLDTSTLTLSPLRIQPLLGRVACAAEWNGLLHVFVITGGSSPAKGGHYSYDRNGESRRERRLPGDAPPAALAGGSAELPGLWAVVDAAVYQQVQIDWDAYQRSLQTQPAEADETGQHPPAASGAAVASRPTVLPTEGTFLVSYDGNNWQPGFRAPVNVPMPARVWLAISGDTCHLFWQASPADASLHYAQRDKDAWMEMPPLRFARPVVGGCAGVQNRLLVFAALQDDESGGGLRCDPRVFLDATHTWSEQPAIKQPDGKLLLMPKDSVLAGYRDMLAFLRRSHTGSELALYTAVSGRQVLPFTAVPTHKPEESMRAARLWELGLLVAVAISLIVYWWRRADASIPATLPAGLAMADLGRRAVAGLIDMAPAALIAGTIWHAPLAEYATAWRTNIDIQDPGSPSITGLLWPWVCFAVVYTGWCMVFELLRSAPPGKQLLRCTVLTTSAERPTTLQIVIRNASRLLETLPFLQFWPFLLLLVMTRNHQRLGDLLARTIVVEHVPPPADTDQSDE